MPRRDLAARADADAKAMHDILVAQRERIEKTNKVAPQLQLQFEFADEVVSFKPIAAIGKNDWKTLRAKSNEEPERIRRTYDVTAERLNPSGSRTCGQ